VTEIPEHLLKRSKSAKAKADGAEAPADAPAGSAPVPAVASTAPVAKAAAPAPVAPVAKPDSPVVAAYKARKKVPVWAMVGLSILPVWAFMYVLALKPVTAKASGPTGDGAVAYATNCSGCHGAGGEGAGAAYAFVGGSVMKTFPHIEDQLRWVSYGTQKYQAAGVEIYGDPNREGGAHKTGASGGQMPGWKGNLTDAEILAAVCHERYDLGGGDAASPEYALWCAADSPIYAALKDGSATFETLATKFADKKIIDIGKGPAAGSTKG
jgi:mono/diheme cytochrome c family protein